MKSAMVGSVAVMMLIATFVIIGTMQLNTNVRDQLFDSVDNAIYATQRFAYDKRKEIKSNNEYLDEFNQNLKKQVGDIDGIRYSVSVYGVDYQKGLLDVGVTATYRNLYGQTRKVHCRRTMVIDETPK